MINITDLEIDRYMENNSRVRVYLSNGGEIVGYIQRYNFSGTFGEENNFLQIGDLSRKDFETKRSAKLPLGNSRKIRLKDITCLEGAVFKEIADSLKASRIFDG